MSKYSELQEAVSIVNNEMKKELDVIKRKYQYKKDNIIFNSLDFKIGEDILKFDCQGSGYIGKYLGIENENIILSLCNKSGVEKGKKFSCHYLEFERLIKITK